MAFRGDIRRKPFLRKRLRKFKHFDGQIGNFVSLAIDRFHHERQFRDPVTQFLTFLRKCFGVDRITQRQIQQPILLLHCLRVLPLEISKPLLIPLPFVPRPQANLFADQFPNPGVLNFHFFKHDHDLFVELLFTKANARMTFLCISGAAVVNILPLGPALELLDDTFARDRMATVGALNKFAGVKQFMGKINLVAQQNLDTLPRL